jgi:hypothetical protein
MPCLVCPVSQIEGELGFIVLGVGCIVIVSLES